MDDKRITRSVQRHAVNKQKISNCEYPCPCGYYGDSEKQCTCTMAVVNKYQSISGPVLDRIDSHLDVPCVPMQKLASLGALTNEPSTNVRQRAEATYVILGSGQGILSRAL